MAGLLDELSKYKFNPNATSMGLLQAGSQMLANSGPSYQPQGGFGSALGQGLGGFTQGYMGFNQNQQEQEMLRQRMELERKKLAQEQFRLDNPQHSVDPYTSIERGPNGELYLANHRETDPTKVLQRVLVDGGPVRAGSLDPITQGAIQNAKSGNTFSKQTMGDGSEKTMLNYTASRLSGIDQASGPTVQSSGGSTGVFSDPASELVRLGIHPTGDKLLDSKTLIDYYNSNPNAATPVNGAGSPISIGQNTADKEAQQVLGKSRAEVAINYPKMEANAMQMISELEALRTHPGMKGMVGAPDSIAGAVNFVFGGSDGKTKLISGTEEASFQARLEQLRGGQFMQAYTALKGGGAITEKEGEKAENAMGRMQTAQSEKEFIQAIDDFESAIAASLESAKTQAGGYAPSGKAAPPPVSNDGWSLRRAK